MVPSSATFAVFDGRTAAACSGTLKDSLSKADALSSEMRGVVPQLPMLLQMLLRISARIMIASITVVGPVSIVIRDSVRIAKHATTTVGICRGSGSAMIVQSACAIVAATTAAVDHTGSHWITTQPE